MHGLVRREGPDLALVSCAELVQVARCERAAQVRLQTAKSREDRLICPLTHRAPTLWARLAQQLADPSPRAEACHGCLGTGIPVAGCGGAVPVEFGQGEGAARLGLQ